MSYPAGTSTSISSFVQNTVPGVSNVLACAVASFWPVESRKLTCNRIHVGDWLPDRART